MVRGRARASSTDGELLQWGRHWSLYGAAWSRGIRGNAQVVSAEVLSWLKFWNAQPALPAFA
jgi:hypothetical protein